ncbi:hypothetical protein Aperf_G00000062842 [Anoplocephala perfoliata]
MPDFSHVKAVCFDVDGTVCPDEGIDEIGEFCGKGDFVREMTIAAMEGRMTMEESLEKQLSEIELTREGLDTLISNYPLKLTEGVERLFKSLRASGVDIYLVSGGFFDLVNRAAQHLGVPEDHVYANKFIFDKNGKVIDFDRNQPTSHTHGKTEVIKLLKSKLDPRDGVLIIGDGATDAEASPPADAFIGFGGVYEREPVKAKTKYYFYSFDEIHRFFEETGLIKTTRSTWFGEKCLPVLSYEWKKPPNVDLFVGHPLVGQDQPV